MATTQQQFLNDVKTKIRMYLYRSLETSFDPAVHLMQELSGVGPLNWHTTANKQRLQNVLVGLSTAINDYSITDGDFRSYLLLKMVDITYNEFSEELFNAYVSGGYGVIPESVVGNLETAYSTQPPQNTQFPGQSTGTNSMTPLTQRLVPNTLYSTE